MTYPTHPGGDYSAHTHFLWVIIVLPLGPNGKNDNTRSKDKDAHRFSDGFVKEKQDLESRSSCATGADSKRVTGWRQHTRDVCRRSVERLLYARAAPTWCVSATEICSASVKMGPSAIYSLYTRRTWSFETEMSHAATIFW